MKCPNCAEVKLVMTDRQGIEIDYCPECRGVWLDRGELDKLIEKSTSTQSSQPVRTEDSRDSRDYKDSKDDYRKEHYYKRKKSFLSDIFD